MALWLGSRLDGVEDAVAAATLPRFATAAPGLVIKRPREISHPERIALGRDVKLGPNCVLKVQTRYPGGWLKHPEGEHVEQTFDAAIEIGDRVTATSGLQITAFERVTVEDDVLFAGNVFIADGTHAMARGDVAYKYQGIERIAPVHVERGAWIGQNVMLMPGVRIGAFAVIGANSVVRDDVPGGCVAVGTPAAVIRRWDADTEGWVAVERGARSGPKA